MKVAVVMGSKSDWHIMKKAIQTLKELKIEVEYRILSAHRTPVELEKFIDCSKADVFICGAGGAAHLAGFVASRVAAPVIGVPISNSMQGIDSLLSTVQMPSGFPVATVAVDGAINAAILAAQIVAIKHGKLWSTIHEYRDNLSKKILQDNGEIQELPSNTIEVFHESN